MVRASINLKDKDTDEANELTSKWDIIFILK